MEEPDLNFQTFTDFIDSYLKDKVTDDDYIFNHKDQIADLLTTGFLAYFNQVFHGNGLAGEDLQTLSMIPKNITKKYLLKENQLLDSTCELAFSVSKHINSNDRILGIRFSQHNEVLQNIFNFCTEATSQDLPTSSTTIKNFLSLDIGSLFHFALHLRKSIARYLIECNIDFFTENQKTITQYETLGKKSGLLEDQLSISSKSSSPDDKDPIPEFDVENWDLHLSDVESYNHDLALSSDESCSEILRSSISNVHSAPEAFLEARPNHITEISDNNKNRFVGMLSSNRFDEVTYQSMLHNSTIELANSGRTVPNGVKDESSSENVVQVDKQVSDSIEDTKNLPDIPDVTALIDVGMKDPDSTIRSHVFALGETLEKISEFLDTLKTKEVEANTLTSPTKASDNVLRELKQDWAKITKEMEKCIQSSIRDNVDKNDSGSQLLNACMTAKSHCKAAISRLSSTLSLNIGLHADTVLWDMSIRSLPKGVKIGEFSNPSIFCYIVSFLNLLKQNPVQKTIYMPSLFNTLSEKNASVISNIRVNYNPDTYLDLFKIILDKYSSIPATLQSILNKMDSVGQLQTASSFEDFVTELDKSSNFQAILNVISSWIRVISTFYDQDTDNLILQGPHSSSLIAKMKACFVAEKTSASLLDLLKKSPSDQFHQLVTMYTQYHMEVQEYINQLKHVKLAPAKRSVLRFREANNLSGTLDTNPKGLSLDRSKRYETYSSFNADLGKVFDLLISKNWTDSSIPHKMIGANSSTADKLISQGINKRTAEIIAILMVVPCPVCTEYCCVNVDGINNGKVHLVPHFFLNERRTGEVRPSLRAASCPTFLALDVLERNKAQAGLNLCRICTSGEGPNHNCGGSLVVCINNNKTNKLFCSCNLCVNAINYQRGKCVEMQKNYISSNGLRVLMNGGHSANHVADISKMIMSNSRSGSSLNSIESNDAVFNGHSSLKLSSIDELKSRVQLDTSNQKRASRFSIVFVRNHKGNEVCLILDTGASTSTMTTSGINDFYHASLDHPVTLKVATGIKSTHEESVVAIPLMGRKNHLAVSFLAVDHSFDSLESIDTRAISDMLYEKYVIDCSQRGEERRFDREDFPDFLPKCTPKGLLGIKDIQFNVVVAAEGLIALENIFDSTHKIVLAGPLPHVYAVNLINTEFVNLLEKENDEQNKMTQNTICLTENGQQSLTSRIQTWLSRRRKDREEVPKKKVIKRVAIVKPVMKAKHTQERRTKKALESAVRTYGELILKYISVGQVCDIFMALGTETLGHLERRARNLEPICERCMDKYCIHCMVQHILQSNDTETNPGPGIVHLNEQWRKALGFKAVVIQTSGEGLNCLLHSICTVLPLRSKLNPSGSIKELRRKLETHILNDFVKFIRQAEELTDYKAGMMTRLTSAGEVPIKSIDAYKKVFNSPFYMERLEIVAISSMLKLCINVWINPRTMDQIGEESNPKVHLLLNSRHFSPIVPLNGALHRKELRNLEKTFNHPHLVPNEFPPLVSKQMPLTQPEMASGDEAPGTKEHSYASKLNTPEVITIHDTTSEEDSGPMTSSTWTELRARRRKKGNKQVNIGKGEDALESQNVRSRRQNHALNEPCTMGNSNILATMSWQGVSRPNPFREDIAGGRIDRLSYNDNLPRRTLLRPSTRKDEASKITNHNNHWKQKTDSSKEVIPPQRVRSIKREIFKNDIDTQELELEANRPNFFIGFRITGKKSLSDIKLLQDTLVQKNPKLCDSMNKLHRMHLTLLAIVIPESQKPQLTEAKAILETVLKGVSEFEVNLEKFGHFDDLVFYVKPSSGNNELESLNKKLFKAFTTAGYICDDKFNPHVSIFRGADLPIKDMIEQANSVKGIGSTEFVSDLQISNMIIKDSNDYYKTEHNVKLKEASGECNVITLTDVPLEEEGEMEQVGVEIGSDEKENLKKVSHLLDPSERPRKKFINLYMDMGSFVTTEIKKMKMKISEISDSMDKYVVKNNHLCIMMYTDSTVKLKGPDSMRDFLKLPAFTLSDFQMEKTEGTLSLRLENDKVLQQILSICTKNDLNLIKCCIPIVNNIHQHIAPCLNNINVAEYQFAKCNAKILTQRLLMFEFDTYQNIERYLGCIGAPIPGEVHDISTNEIWSLIGGIERLKEQSPFSNLVLTIGDFLYLFDGDKFNSYDFSIGYRKNFLEKLNERIDILESLSQCPVCNDAWSTEKALAHLMTQHGLRIPSEITDQALQGDLCAECSTTDGRLLHMFQSHYQNPDVHNCCSSMSKSIRLGRIHMDLGDLMLVERSQDIVQHLQAVNDTPINLVDLNHNGTIFNYPDKTKDWKNKSLANVYLSFLVIFRYMQKSLDIHKRTLSYMSVKTPNIEVNFRMFCPILKQSKTFIMFNNQSKTRRAVTTELHIFNASRGRKLMDLKKNEEAAKSIIFHNESEDFTAKIKDHCKPYPHILNVMDRLISLVKSQKDQPLEDGKILRRHLKEIVVISGYLMGFLSFNRKSNRIISPILLEDVVNALAYLILNGRKEGLILAAKEVVTQMGEEKTHSELKLLYSLPQTRIEYVKTDVLNLQSLYVNQDGISYLPEVFRISPLHIFSDDTSFDNATKSTDTFLFVRSNLEVRLQNSRAAKKWLSNNCTEENDTLVMFNRVSGNRTLSEKLINKMDQIGVAHNLIPLHPESLIMCWSFNAAHRNHVCTLNRPSSRKSEHLGTPLTIQNFMRSFALCNQNKVISERIERCLGCKIRRMQFKKGTLGDLPGKSLSYNDISGGLYQIDIIPKIKLSPHGGKTTRQKSNEHIGVVVCVDRLSRFIMLEPLRNRSTAQILLSLESIFIKNGMPRALFCDQESSICALARTQGWFMGGSGFSFSETSDLTVLFTPASGSGHSRNGLSERTILGLKNILGNMDFASANIDLLSFMQILNNLAGKLNNIPIGSKSIRGRTPGLENLLTPEILFKGLRFHPISLPELKNGSEDHTLRQNMLITQNMLSTFVVEYFSQHRSIKIDELPADSQYFEKGWIVSFFVQGNSRPLKKCYDTLKIGEIIGFTDRQNRKPRSALVKYITLTGSPAVRSKVKAFVSKRKISDLVYLFKDGNEFQNNVSSEEAMIKELPGNNDELITFISTYKSFFIPTDTFDETDINGLETVLETSIERDTSESESEGEENEVTQEENSHYCFACEILSSEEKDYQVKGSEVDDIHFKKGVVHILQNHSDSAFEDPPFEMNDRQSVEEVLKQFTTSDFCSVTTCPSCPRCFRCKVTKDLTAAELLERKLAAEEPTLMDCIRLVRPADNDIDKETSPLRVACRIPLDPQRVHLLGNNLDEVRTEFDRKFAKLSSEDRHQFHVAFEDMVKKKVFMKLEEAPMKLQQAIMQNPNHHYLALAPAFKYSSVNTKIRCCVNASKLNKNSVSLNMLTYKGRNDLNLHRSFRQFRAFPYSISADISRFYNGTELEIESIPYQMLSYREGCRPEGQWETYITCKLNFGIASASFLSSAALTLILKFFRIKCKCFVPTDNDMSVGGMSLEELSKIDANLNQFDSPDLPYTKEYPECNSATHIVEKFVASGFVDDLMQSFPTDIRATVEKATNYVLNYFNFYIKEYHWSGKPPDSDSQIPTDPLGIAGYLYSPSSDHFQLKNMQLHNGVKLRGRITKAKKTKSFFHETLDCVEKCTFDYMKNLFISSDTEPTLRLVVSRASSFFDVSGITSPLKNQIVRLLSHFIIMSKQNWNYRIPEQGFDLFLKMISQLAIASFYEFPRFPKKCLREKIDQLTFLWLADSSPRGSEKSNFYFGYKCANGYTGTHLIHCGSKLTPPGLSVPKSEADAISGGSEPFYKIFLEYEDHITSVIAGTDSRCMIFWCLDENGKKDVFITNRCENLINVLKKIPPSVYPQVPDIDPSQGWRNLLFWFAGEPNIMVADVGTKYPIFGETGTGAPLITADKISPTSMHFLGPEWFQKDELVDLWDSGKCRSAAFYHKNSKEFLELEQDVRTDLIPISKENSLGNDKQITILDDQANLKEMLTFLVETSEQKVASPYNTDEDIEPPLLASSDDEDELSDYINEGKFDSKEKDTKVSSIKAKSLPLAFVFIFILMFLVHQVCPTDAPIHPLSALHCEGPEKLFDLTQISTCNGTLFSAYSKGYWVDKSFFYHPAKMIVKGISCTVTAQISTALCNRLNNINKLLGASRTISGFKTDNSHYIIISPDDCKKAHETGQLDLALGNEVFKISNVNGITTDFYLGNSKLSFKGGHTHCNPVQFPVYLNASSPNTRMGGMVVKASISVITASEEGTYLMKDDTLLTQGNEKVSLKSNFKEQDIVPYLPSIRNKKSTVLFLFEEDYRKNKRFKFKERNLKVLQYNSTNSSLPDLIKLSIEVAQDEEIVAAIQLGKLPYVADTKDNGTFSHCFRTHFNDLLVCNDPDSFGSDIPTSPITFRDFLLNRNAGGNSFLQKNIDASLSGILMSLCTETADKMRLLAHNFQNLGGLLNTHSFSEVFTSRSLGEVGELRSCKVETVEATELKQDDGRILCCKYLPVKHMGKTRFLKPISRELGDTCTIEKCGNIPNKNRLYVDLNGSVIRQSAQGIQAINTSKMNYLNPAVGLEIFRFSQLDMKQHRQSGDMSDQEKVRLDYATEMLDDLTLEVSNLKTSANLESSWGLELAKGILPAFVFWLVGTEYGQLVLLIIVVYEGLKLIMTILSTFFTISDILRRKPNNKLEFFINSSTASRKETLMNQKCFEDIQSKLIGDVVDIKATLNYHSNKINMISRAQNRTPHRYYDEKHYKPVNTSVNTSDDDI